MTISKSHFRISEKHLNAQEREKRCVEPSVSVDLQRRMFRSSGTRAMERQPDFLQGGGRLRDYQLDGLNWMIYSWSQDNNCILADEVLYLLCSLASKVLFPEVAPCA